MDFDDDTPPELVNTATKDVDDEITVKVPITIVTGSTATPFVCTTLTGDRLPWCW